MEETETRVADLIPTRPLGVCVLFLLGLTAIAGVQTLHTFVADWAMVIGDDAAATFDVTAQGSLQIWLSSMLFGAAAGFSLLVYVIRRHKMDDYRGRYRMWLWTAAGLVLLSINTVAGLHRAFDGLIVHLVGQTLFDFVPGWSILLCSFLGGIFGLRMLMDMWRSRGASAALIAAGGGYLAAALLIILRPLPVGTMLFDMVTALAFAVGHLMLTLSLLVYARRVLLEARGLIEIKKKRPKTKARPAENSAKAKKSWFARRKNQSRSNKNRLRRRKTNRRQKPRRNPPPRVNGS